MQVMHPAHEGSERGRFDAAAPPRHKRVLLRRIGERRHAVSASARESIDEKPALGIGGNRLHPAPGILALDPLQAPYRFCPKHTRGCLAEGRPFFKRIPTRDIAVEEQRQSRQDEQQEEERTYGTDPAMQTIDESHEVCPFVVQI